MKHYRIKRLVLLLLAVVIMGAVPMTTSPAYGSEKTLKYKIKRFVIKKELHAGVEVKVEAKLKEKAPKSLKYTLRADNPSIVKVPGSVTIKKGKKKGSFKITGRKMGETYIRAWYTTKSGKKSKAKFKVTVKSGCIAVEKVSLNNMSPQVGDTLVATYAPKLAPNVTYTWYSGDSKNNITTIIAGQTKSTLRIRGSLGGKYIKVVAKGASGKAEASTTKPVPIQTKSVSLTPLEPTVGDILTVTVNPINADIYSYAWFYGDTAKTAQNKIDGQNASTLRVPESMVGKYIKVTVTTCNGPRSVVTAQPVKTAGVSSAQIVIPDDPLLIAGEDNYLPLALYDEKGNPITSLEIAKDPSSGVKILAPASGAEVVSQNGSLYIKLNKEVCGTPSEDMLIQVKVLKTNAITEKTIVLGGQAEIMGISEYKGATSASVNSNCAISIRDVVFKDQYDRILTIDDPVLQNLLTNDLDPKNEGKCRILVTSSDPSVASFSSTGEQSSEFLDSTGQNPTILHIRKAGESTIKLKVKAAGAQNEWIDPYLGQTPEGAPIEMAYTFTFTSQ